ncbi:LacI family DNA-binding transcriptional regulator (plasmid) [Agrobacterium leguminum]|uniref:LacI family DNA-binding transcriptional regulator n=1 Tax=Agrobacterium leguminum TaxID=2792015 RepID=UPI002729EAB0|nr:LacI family DNA-binding transcriptional regulator [Agrobacterium leguminum]WLE00755.1 LacI family DNA-binding transcriptional regulator [Agrobacterium leguminum]
MVVSLSDIAQRAGVSVKTVSGALHGGSARMSEATHQRIHQIAKELGYITNLAARGVRQGWMPLVGLVADGLITSPFATEIMRGLDTGVRSADMAVFAMMLGERHDVATVLEEVRRFRPRSIGYAATYHKMVTLPPNATDTINVMINCQDAEGRVLSLVPDDERAALDITRYLLDSGRQSLAFINLPGLLAGELRAVGFRQALVEAGYAGEAAILLPAVQDSTYSDRAQSLVAAHVEALFNRPTPPDAILCGNDRVAMEVYAALNRLGRRIPDDVAVASFDNQVEIATRLDPPLTTMALPHRIMGSMAADILLSAEPPAREVRKIPFQLIERQSI